MNLSIFQKFAQLLGVPTGMQRDVIGNIIANVNHRTGTLASLLALDGGDGEISVATDADAIVVHTGVAGQAKAYRRTKMIGELRTSFSVVVAGGTPAKAVMDGSTYLTAPPGFVYDQINNRFVSPTGTAFVTGSVEIYEGHGVVATKKITANLKSTHVLADLAAYGELYLPVTGMSGHIGLANAGVVSPSTLMFDTEPVSLWIDHNDGANSRTISGEVAMQFWEAP